MPNVSASIIILLGLITIFLNISVYDSAESSILCGLLIIIGGVYHDVRHRIDKNDKR